MSYRHPYFKIISGMNNMITTVMFSCLEPCCFFSGGFNADRYFKKIICRFSLLRLVTSVRLTQKRNSKKHSAINEFVQKQDGQAARIEVSQS